MRNKSVGVGVANTSSIVKDVTKFIIVVIMMSEKRLRFTMESDKLYSCIFDNGNELTCFELVDLLNEQQSTIDKQENEIMKLKSLLNFSEKMMDTDLIINLRYSYGKWNADLRVIDDE